MHASPLQNRPILSADSSARQCQYARMTSQLPAAFRPIQSADLPLLHRWHHAPHIDRWWRQPLSLAEIEAKYAGAIAGTSPTRVFMILRDQRPVGWFQWYHWRDYPKHAGALGVSDDEAGLDLAIGEPDLCGQGIGSSVIEAALRELIFPDPAICACVVDPELANERSRRAFTRAGFTEVRRITLPAEDYARCIMRRQRPARQILES